MIFNPCPPSWSMFPMTLGTHEKHDIFLMIKTTAKNVRVTHSRKHLTRNRNQIRATKSLEYIFHYNAVEKHNTGLLCVFKAFNGNFR